MTKTTRDQTTFTYEQIKLICHTPKDVLNAALPEAFGVKGRVDQWEGDLRIIGRGSTICEVSYNIVDPDWSYEHGLAHYANPRLEAAARGLMTTLLEAAQEHALRTSNDTSMEAEAARALAQFIADPHAVPEAAPEEILEDDPSPV